MHATKTIILCYSTWKKGGTEELEKKMSVGQNQLKHNDGSHRNCLQLKVQERRGEAVLQKHSRHKTDSP